MDVKPDITDLLAQRDRRLLDADMLPHAQEIETLNDLTSQVRGMSDVPVDDQVWGKLSTRLDTPRRRQWHWTNYPLSTAASVLVVSAVFVLTLFSGPGSEPGEPLPVFSSVPEPQLIALIDQSRALEERAYGVRAWQGGGQSDVTVSPVGELLLMRLAQVDAEISNVQSQGRTDDTDIEALWTSRVELLRLFLAEMEAQNPGRFEDGSTL